MTSSLRRTPLYDRHEELGARMVEFGGWEMPVYYVGINEEHRAVRARAGLFDVSHMGQLEITGSGAEALLRTGWKRGRPSTPSCSTRRAASSTI
jgi:aminomethyltransferase